MKARVKYGSSVTTILPDSAARVLVDILDGAGIDSVVVTSTTRSPEQQAKAMYENLACFGVTAQRKLYKDAGNQVIDVYENQSSLGQTAAQVIAEMARKIREVGPDKVSAHCADPGSPSDKIVFDVAPSSIPEDEQPLFETTAALNSHVVKFLHPREDEANHPEDTQDPAYHLEVAV